MNVLELIKAACYEQGISSIPSTVASGTTDFASLQLLNLLYAECRFLRNQKFWPQCKKRYSFALTASRVNYPLPQDYYTSLSDTAWDETNSWQMVGPLGDAAFRWRQLGVVTFENRRAYRIFGPDGNPNTTGGQLQIDPSPSSTDTLSFEYITKTLFMPKYWITATAFAAGSYCSASGNIYQTTAGGTTGATIPSHTSGSVSDGTVTWTYIAPPYEAVIADTDMSIFDDDILISGIKWRYNESKGVMYERDPILGVPKHHANLVNSAKARWMSSYRASLEANGFSIPIVNVSEGSWSI